MHIPSHNILGETVPRRAGDPSSGRSRSAARRHAPAVHRKTCGGGEQQYTVGDQSTEDRGTDRAQAMGGTRPVTRCAWSSSDPLMIAYHDTEWGVPVHDDRKLFEFLVLDAFQAGLSWAIILAKRENFRRALHGFDAKKIARYTAKDVARLLADPGIVRNRLKIEATIVNARRFLEIQREFGLFDAYIWQFVGGRPIQNRRRAVAQIPARTKESDAMSQDLRARGFRFVGSTICYAFMQAAGMVNDHTVNCFRYHEVSR
jgi:DNA-3-methyladenine glycosylase I